jgi:hypothetical protein
VPVVSDEDVIRLDVAVDEVLPMQLRNRLDDRFESLECIERTALEQT